MGEALWDWDALVGAAGGVADGRPAAGIDGVSIDSRDIQPGDLFVALKDQRDGHAFVPAAFRNGAAAALVREDYERAEGDGALIRVDDPLAALTRIAATARARLGADARVVAVTGSAGKTTTKEMLRACFEATAPGRVHASVKSYNNHWGVPLTLARMPADTAFAVIEIGMNHAGEIRPLTRLARPHVAVVTTIAPAHIGNFGSIEEIAEAKAEIFEGLGQTEDGIAAAILPRDSAFFGLLGRRAQAAIATGKGGGAGFRGIVSFGSDAKADCRLMEAQTRFLPDATEAIFHCGEYFGARIAVPGRHNAVNAAAALASWLIATSGLKLQAERGEPILGITPVLHALAHLRLDPQGRGQVYELDEGITLIDESYNANPASMRAALATLTLYPRERRRIAVLGDMLELGARAGELHVGLKDAIDEAGVDLVFASGPNMCALFHELAPKQRGLWADNSQGI
ncbi:MAG: hypothetical protein RLZZ303_2724, partial [Candidatus Hydrogenedentota bacterium]